MDTYAIACFKHCTDVEAQKYSSYQRNHLSRNLFQFFPRTSWYESLSLISVSWKEKEQVIASLRFLRHFQRTFKFINRFSLWNRTSRVRNLFKVILSRMFSFRGACDHNRGQTNTDTTGFYNMKEMLTIFAVDNINDHRLDRGSYCVYRCVPKQIVFLPLICITDVLRVEEEERHTRNRPWV